MRFVLTIPVYVDDELAAAFQATATAEVQRLMVRLPGGQAATPEHPAMPGF